MLDELNAVKQEMDAQLPEEPTQEQLDHYSFYLQTAQQYSMKLVQVENTFELNR